MSDDTQAYFEQRLRAALEEYFDGDAEAVDKMMTFVKDKAEEFRS